MRRDERIGGQLAVVDRRVGADLLHLDVHRARPARPIRRDHHLVLGWSRSRPTPGRPARSGAGVQAVEQVAGRDRAAGRRPGTAPARSEPSAASSVPCCGEPRVTIRRAIAAPAVVADPEPGHDAAGRVADHVDRRRAGRESAPPGRGGQHRGLRGQVALGVAGQARPPRVLARPRAAGRPARCSAAGRAAVAGHQQHRPGHAPGRRRAANPGAATGRHARPQHRPPARPATTAQQPSTRRRRAGASEESTLIVPDGGCAFGLRIASSRMADLVHTGSVVVRWISARLVDLADRRGGAGRRRGDVARPRPDHAGRRRGRGRGGGRRRRCRPPSRCWSRSWSRSALLLGVRPVAKRHLLGARAPTGTAALVGRGDRARAGWTPATAGSG